MVIVLNNYVLGQLFHIKSDNKHSYSVYSTCVQKTTTNPRMRHHQKEKNTKGKNNNPEQKNNRNLEKRQVL